jgi:hypothetical protein
VFELRELDAGSGQPTGRKVFFANSYIFVSPATPFFQELNPERHAAVAL